MKFDHGKIDILKESETLKTLASGSIGHLGCFSQDDVYVVPITYVFENPYIYSHSKDGKKISMMRQNPRVCVEVEEVRGLFEWKSVIAWGRFEELHGDQSAKAMRLLIKKSVEQRANGRTSDLELDFESLFEDAIIYRIRVEKVSGRFEGDMAGLHQRMIHDTTNI